MCQTATTQQQQTTQQQAGQRQQQQQQAAQQQTQPSSRGAPEGADRAATAAAAARATARQGEGMEWREWFFFLALLLLRVIATHAPTLGRAAVVGRRRRAARLRLDVARVTVRALALSSSCVAATYSCENRPSPRPIRALRPASTSPIARGRVAFWHAPRPHQARACREPWRLLVALPSTRSLAPANQRLRVPRRRRQDSKEGL